MARYHRLVVAFLLLVGVNVALAVEYWLINQGRTNPDGSAIDFLQCLYMTVISTFTVGYDEAIPIVTPTDKIYTMLVIVLGLGTMGYGVSQMTAFVVEGKLLGILERRKMDKRIAAMRDHFVVCGTGDVGHYVIEEMLATQRPVVVVDEDEEHLKKLFEERSFPYVVGDATDEEILAAAGIKTAAGVVCALEHDRDNLVLAMTCRMHNPKIRIVAKCHDIKLSQRIKNAGADSVVSPQFIGGMRLVSEMVRPTVVNFLDLMLRDKEKGIRVEEVRIEAGSALAGRRLADHAIADSDVLVMALQAPGATAFIYGPPSNTVLQPGFTMVVLGDTEHVRKLCLLATGGR
ncbi:MAG: potassium channel protein [Nitrospirae bacterium]|nr:potassium channel protein [Nitrospirota bacterium]